MVYLVVANIKAGNPGWIDKSGWKNFDFIVAKMQLFQFG